MPTAASFRMKNSRLTRGPFIGFVVFLKNGAGSDSSIWDLSRLFFI
jgi:hypothetical protein